MGEGLEVCSARLDAEAESGRFGLGRSSVRRFWLLLETSAESLCFPPALLFSKFGKCHFRSKSFHYSHFVGKVRQFGSIVGKIESHVQELQILLFLTKVTASETENAILPKQLRTKTPIFNNLNFRKLVLWEIGTSKEEEFGKIAVSVFNAVSTGV